MELRFRAQIRKPVTQATSSKKCGINAELPPITDPIWLPMIDSINRKDRERRRPPAEDRPQVHIDDGPPPNWRRPPEDREEPSEERGVIIIQL